MITIVCNHCKKKIKKFKCHIRHKHNFCSPECASEARRIYQDKSVDCGWCKKHIFRKGKELAKSKSKLAFCNHSCCASYVNANKTSGSSRSKFEKFVEQELKKLYSFTILFNDRSIIDGLELDIYIPGMKLAFEINGIFHYEPIYGKDKLEKTQNNDGQKLIRCYKSDIELVIVDISKINYFKESIASIYLKIITDIINMNLGRLN